MAETEHETPRSEETEEQPSATATEDKNKPSAMENKDKIQPGDVVSPPHKETIPNSTSTKEIVLLNVGGARFEVARDTLMRYEGSMLANLISGKWKEGDGKNEIFIDRDGRRFGYILEYLRSDCVHLPHLSARSALMEEFEYFGINADASKILVNHDFMCLDKLKKEILIHQAAIEQKEKEVAAILESYRMAKEFSEYVKSWGLNLMMQISVQKNVDKDLLRDCLLSRGLQVAKDVVKEDGTVIVHVASLGMNTNENK